MERQPDERGVRRESGGLEREGATEGGVSPRRRSWPVRTVSLGHSENLGGSTPRAVCIPSPVPPRLQARGDPPRVKGLGGRQGGWRRPPDSQVLLRLAGIPEPSVYGKASWGRPAAGSGQHQRQTDGQAEDRAASTVKAPPRKGALPGATQWERKRSPPSPLKE